jgi:hypothetical protein
MLKRFGIGMLVVALVSLVAIAAVRETTTRKQEQSVSTGPTMGVEARPALTPAEEKFAHELWAVHSNVKQAAVKMTFAGLSYKLGDIPRAALKERVAPLVPEFAAALAQAERIEPPASAAQWHRKYVEAIGLYREAAAAMVKAGSDADLVEAQEKSGRASTLTLVVGDQLWPGEYKPN